MKTHLLKTTLIAATLSSVLTACDTADKGKDYNFSSEEQVSFATENLQVSLTEGNGSVEVDLLAGAMVGDVALSGSDLTVFVSEMVFPSPEETVPAKFYTYESPSVGVVNQTISPFSLTADSKKLVVNTDAFDYPAPSVHNNAWRSSLHECDMSDENSGRTTGQNAGIIPGPDGLVDNPSSVTYNISYVVDAGFVLAPGEEPARRTLSLTINAAPDVVTEVVAADIELPAGGTAQLVAQTNPSYACSDLSLTYSVADTNIATVNANTGEVTGVSQGTTEVTITHTGTGMSTTANITVTSGFTLAITNQPNDELGSPVGMKEVPACTMTGVVVEPSNAAGDLTGSYTYDWMSSNPDVAYASEHMRGFGATGMFSTGTENPADLDNLPTTTVTVGYLTGDTGSNDSADTADKSIELTVQPNAACNSVATSSFDNTFDSDQKPYAPIGTDYGSSSRKATAGINGSGAISFVRNSTPLPVPDNTANSSGVAGVNFFDWQAGPTATSWFAVNYAQFPESHNKTIKVSMWAKVIKADPTNTDDVTVTHHLLPWVVVDGPDRGPKRAIGPNFKGTIPGDANGEWVYIEFMDVQWTDGAIPNDSFTIPDTWVHKNGNAEADSSMVPEWIFDGLSAGDEILIDEYSIIEK
ncbi:Ig-like domain-containing protein [Thalassotalea agariperforans]